MKTMEDAMYLRLGGSFRRLVDCFIWLLLDSLYLYTNGHPNTKGDGYWNSGVHD